MNKNLLDPGGPAARAYKEMAAAMLILSDHLQVLLATTQIMNVPGFKGEDEILDALITNVSKKGIELGEIIWPEE